MKLVYIYHRLDYYRFISCYSLLVECVYISVILLIRGIFRYCILQVKFEYTFQQYNYYTYTMPNLLYLYLPICPDTYLICTDPLTRKANICKCYPSKFCTGYLSNICKFDHVLTLAKFVPLLHSYNSTCL